MTGLVFIIMNSNDISYTRPFVHALYDVTCTSIVSEYDDAFAYCSLRPSGIVTVSRRRNVLLCCKE